MTTFELKPNTYHVPQANAFGPLGSRSLQHPRRTMGMDVEHPSSALESSDAGMEVNTKDLLALLSHCYAAEVYGSVEIENLLARDVIYRSLPLDIVPRAPMIRHFRKNHHQAIEHCLAEILRCRAEQKVKEGFVTKANHWNFAAEARRRLVTAMFVDSMELDGE